MSAALVANVKKMAWLGSNQTLSKSGTQGTLYFLGREEKGPSKVIQSLPKWKKDQIKSGRSIVSWVGRKGPVWLLQAKTIEKKDHYGFFTPTAYGMARDLIGACLRQVFAENPSSINIEYIGQSEDEFKGMCVGLELAQYSFDQYWPKLNPTKMKVQIKSKFKNQKDLVKQASQIAESVNLARYLVDLPPNELNPKTYSELIKGLFGQSSKLKVTVWDEKRLEKEKMGLHAGVGKGALHGPRLVHLQYRNGGKKAPIAFVGKGITFDTGGLDIKPAAGMRNMKKDMGGSASVAAIAYWVFKSGAKINCDFYLALAENSVSKESVRPGDILTARDKKTIEIHNTDAEGRLVLADALTVATEKKPSMVIDIATLTGAIKYGLGTSTPGIFSNDDNLAEVLLRSGQATGDVFWRMPLVPEEKARLHSDVADMVNCADGFGGAVTAALFLESFTNGVPWAHFDIYAWTDRAKGALRKSGGTGQIVQAVCHFLQHQ